MRFVVIAVIATALALPLAPALAADEHASCTGLGLSDHARAGEMPGVIQEVKGVLSELDVNAGAFVSRFSQVHAGTHDPGCETAAESIIGDLAGG